MARTTSGANGSPTHTAWVTTRLCCNSSSSVPSLRSGLPPGRPSRARMRAEQLVGIAAEARGHAVDGLLPRHLFGQEIRGVLHAAQLRGVELHAHTVGRQGDFQHCRRA